MLPREKKGQGREESLAEVVHRAVSLDATDPLEGEKEGLKKARRGLKGSSRVHFQ